MMQIAGMTGRRARWQIALADLSLLLACAMAVQGGINSAERAAPVQLADQDIASLFVEGEAMLSVGGVTQLDRIMPKGRIAITVEYSGANPTARLSQWELAAARTARLARYWQARGMTDAALILNAPRLGTKNRVHLASQ